MCVDMTFVQNLSKINKLVFLFGVSPFLLNRRTNKFECSIYTLTYTIIYFLSLSTALVYISIFHYVSEKMFKTTSSILTLLQQATVMVIFNCMMMDLILKKGKHANFLNSLVKLKSNVTKLNRNGDSKNELSSTYKHVVFVICFNAIIYILTSISISHRRQILEHLWIVLQFFQSISIALVAYYMRCFVIVLHSTCTPIFNKLDSIGNDLRSTIGASRQHISQLLTCFESFDEVMDLKAEFSEIFGIQLLLNSAFDFIMLTISVYGFLHAQVSNLIFLCYFSVFIVPIVVKCVLLVLALDTLANQV